MGLSRSLHSRTRNFAAIAIGAIFLTITGSVVAADPSKDPWRVIVTVPLWAPGIDGDLTAKGKTADVDVGFDDLWDHLDAAYALAVEARKERFGFYGDFGYMKFSADPSGARGTSGDAELKFLVADAGMAYRLVKRGEKRPFILEAMAGVRYWYIETDLEVTGPRGRRLVDGDWSKSLIDPAIGLHTSQYLNPKWHLDFQGDIGGFGISNDSSDFDWSALGLLSYDVKRWLSLSAGYRALATDSEDGSGAKKKGADIIMHGVLLTVSLKF